MFSPERDLIWRPAAVPLSERHWAAFSGSGNELALGGFIINQKDKGATRRMAAEKITSSLAEWLVRGVRNGSVHRLPVLLMGVVTLGLFAFISIADEMAEGEIRNIDETLFLLLRVPGDPSTPLGPEWLQEIALEVTAVGGFPLIILTLAAVTGFFIVTKRYGAALYAVLSVGSGALLSQTLKQYYARPRPDLVDHLDNVHTLSFPSGHALVTTVAYLTLAALVIGYLDDRRARAYVLLVAIFVAVLVGVSRVYLGVHWPSDVAAGWALGAAWASFSWLIVHFLKRNRNLKMDS
ncbi:phosphatase PAP2 family protein [Hoeflea sp.]|uniref:phosphatase PAP2 family protein n=1 Tax=Hoeflea sp. TaxID=1940281 RepID=UPI003A8F6E03